MSKSTYSEKLRDPRWQRLRLEVMNRDSFTCLNCGDRETTLNVHHLQYHGDPWESPLNELETLCERCHSDRSTMNKEILAKDTRTFFKWITYINAGIKSESQPRPRKVLIQNEAERLRIEQTGKLLKDALARQGNPEPAF